MTRLEMSRLQIPAVGDVSSGVTKVGETGSSCIKGQVVTEVFYENIAHIWIHNRQ